VKGGSIVLVSCEDVWVWVLAGLIEGIRKFVTECDMVDGRYLLGVQYSEFIFSMMKVCD
jgi:hypothetical protein